MPLRTRPRVARLSLASGGPLLHLHDPLVGGAMLSLDEKVFARSHSFLEGEPLRPSGPALLDVPPGRHQEESLPMKRARQSRPRQSIENRALLLLLRLYQNVRLQVSAALP